MFTKFQQQPIFDTTNIKRSINFVTFNSHFQCLFRNLFCRFGAHQNKNVQKHSDGQNKITCSFFTALLLIPKKNFKAKNICILEGK